MLQFIMKMPAINMSSSPYTFRNYRPEDFDNYVLLRQESEKLKPDGRNLSTQAVTEYLCRPHYSPEYNLFVAETAGNIVGYTDVTAELAIGRVILDCWIHPEHRQKGLAAKLMDYTTRRAQELGVRVIHVNVAEDNTVAKKVLSGLGFECVRQFLELRLDMETLRPQDIDRASRDFRYLRHGEEETLARIQNHAFDGHWGYNPNTVEEIIYHLNSSNCSYEDVVLTTDGEKIIGYCWLDVSDVKEAATGERKGRIFMLAANPDYRSRGAGKRVLLAGLTHLRSKGIRIVELTVDSKNRAARILYHLTGFKTRTSSLWYEKIINQDTSAK